VDRKLPSVARDPAEQLGEPQAVEWGGQTASWKKARICRTRESPVAKTTTSCPARSGARVKDWMTSSVPP
jgi:hypothetical protein